MRYIPLRMAVVSKARSVEECAVPEPRVRQQIFPLYDLNHAPEFTAELLNPPTTVGGCPPAVRVDFQLSYNVSHYITVKNTVICDPDSRVVEILDLTGFELRYILANLIHGRITLFVILSPRMFELHKHHFG